LEAIVKNQNKLSIIGVIALGLSMAPHPANAEEAPMAQVAEQAAENPGDLPYENPAEEAVTIFVPRSVHFQAPGGSDLTVEPGEYRLEAEGSSLRLVSGERQDSLVIQAEKGTHETENEVPIGVAVPGDTEEEADQFNVLLLLPGGSSLEANGTYSGIRPRGFSFKKAWSKAKIGVNHAYKQTKAVTSDIKKGADLCVTHPEQCKQKGGGIFKEKANEHLNDAAQLAKRASQEFAKESCKAFFAAQKAVAKAEERVVGTMMQAADRLRRNAKVVNDLIATVEAFNDAQKELIYGLVRKAVKFNNPAMLSRIKVALDPEYYCENGIPTTRNELMTLLSDSGTIRTRGITNQVMSLGVQGAGMFPVKIGGGLEGGGGAVWDLRGHFKGYNFVGGTVSLPQFSIGMVAQVPWWNPNIVKVPEGLRGGYLAIGYALPVKELEEAVPGWVKGEQGVPPFKGGGGKNVTVMVDVIFSWPNGALYPNPNPAGVVVSLGAAEGLTKLKETFLTKHLGRVTLQGGYTWVTR
jgi:hypothetical protein